MKKMLFTVLLIMFTLVADAIPAKKDVWRIITLPDGSETRAQLMGDEHLHYWQTEDGRRFVCHGDTFTEADISRLQQRAVGRKARQQAICAARRAAGTDGRSSYRGEKRGLVILAQFTDVTFKTGNNQDKYQQILNAENFTSDEGFVGSVADYFRDQSHEQFRLTFDVVGPYTMQHNQKYYGENDEDGYDLRPHEMIIEACQQADGAVNFADYDWDGDGMADQVYVVYAGKGEADGGGKNTIWPHMWTLHNAGTALTLDNTAIDIYACSNEMDASGRITGIGLFCHEFSHCLGFPDTYDTLKDRLFTMGCYDLMCSGCYNGNSFVPAGYSAYEKWTVGWIELTELSVESVSVDDLKPVSEGSSGYIIYNDAHPSEYFIVENRQQTHWDSRLPGHGLMVTQVDYDEDIWACNIPNSYVTPDESQDKDGPYYMYPVNDHLRLSILHADNTAYSSSEATDLYPYAQSDSVTFSSAPAARFYNVNRQGSHCLPGGLYHIAENADGTMRFDYVVTPVGTGITAPSPMGKVGTGSFCDLFGRRVVSPRKGLYIRQKQKVIIQ